VTLCIPGVNITNIFQAAFLYKSGLHSFSLLLQFGLVILCQKIISAKDAFKMLAKQILGVNFINVLRARFLNKILFSSNVLALNKLSYEKHVRKMLMKLTVGGYFTRN
jgi:hypothetical protein